MQLCILHVCMTVTVLRPPFVMPILMDLKLKNIFIVHTEFGYSFNTGKERKPIEYSKKEDSFFEAKLGPIPMNVSEIEDTFNGIYCPNTQIAIRFIDTENDKQRVWVRKSEIAKTIKLILEQNGYNDKALDYYFFHRRFRRKTISSWFKRWSELLWGELFWGYGVKIINPVITFFINTILFSVIYSLLPYNLYLTEAGMSINNKLVYIYNTDTGVLISEYLKILYGSFLISSLSIFGSVDVHGIACLFAIIQIQISILLLGLGVTALGKRMSNI